jgi:hypothetical protein
VGVIGMGVYDSENLAKTGPILDLRIVNKKMGYSLNCNPLI